MGKNVLARYFGDEEVSTRQVQLTLKILDCGHFRLKQTLQGSGPSPYWVIFEGRWKRTPRRFRLEFCIRYPFQKSRKHQSLRSGSGESKHPTTAELHQAAVLLHNRHLDTKRVAVWQRMRNLHGLCMWDLCFFWFLCWVSL